MKYFGTDGIRGVPNDTLKPELVLRLGQALQVLGESELVLGTDTRVSKDMLSAAIVAGATAVGINVHHIGVLPTPGVIYTSLKRGCLGVMITASHNPYQDNGIKVFYKGYKLTPEQEQAIEEYIDNPVDYKGEVGTFSKDITAKEDYIAFLKRQGVKTNFRIAIDCANGATVYTAPDVLRPYVASLFLIGDKPNGTNINLHCGSTHLEKLVPAVKQHGCDLGLAFDGDGDRIQVVLRDGRVFDGDHLLYLFGTTLKELGSLKKDKVVLTVMSNPGIEKAFEQAGIEVEETPVGDKNVFAKLEEEDLSLGGETSGHIILRDALPTGDGVLNGLSLLAILKEKGLAAMDEIMALPMYTEKYVNLRVPDKKAVAENEELQARIKEMLEEVNGDGKIVVRPSGTENLIRLNVMMKDPKVAEDDFHELAEKIRKIK